MAKRWTLFGLLVTVSVGCGGAIAPNLSNANYAIPTDSTALGAISLLGIGSTSDVRVPTGIRVAALDPGGNVNTDYQGTLLLSSSDANATLPTQLVFSAGDGGRKVLNIHMRSLGSQTVTVTDSHNPRLTMASSTTVTWPTTGIVTQDTPGVVHNTRTFFGQGRVWATYVDAASNLYLISTTDGTHFSPPVLLRTGVPATGDGLAVASDGNCMDYAISGSSLNTPIYYRRAMLQADGGLMWRAAEQIAVTADPARSNWYITLAIDAGAMPWIGYLPTDGASGGGGYYNGTVTHSSRNDGAWATAAGFPFATIATLGYNFVYPVPLADGQVLVLGSVVGTSIQAQLYNGSSFGPTEQVCANCTALTAAALGATGNDVGIAYLDGNHAPVFVVRSAAQASYSAATPLVNELSAPTLVAGAHDTTMAVSVGSDAIHVAVRTAGTWSPPWACVVDPNLSNARAFISATLSPQGQSSVIVIDSAGGMRTIMCP